MEGSKDGGATTPPSFGERAEEHGDNRTGGGGGGRRDSLDLPEDGMRSDRQTIDDGELEGGGRRRPVQGVEQEGGARSPAGNSGLEPPPRQPREPPRGRRMPAADMEIVFSFFFSQRYRWKDIRAVEGPVRAVRSHRPPKSRGPRLGSIYVYA